MVSAHLFQGVITLLNTRKNKVLLFAQMAMTESQYLAFKKLFLDELGERGLERELKVLLIEKQHGASGNGQE